VTFFPAYRNLTASPPFSARTREGLAASFSLGGRLKKRESTLPPPPVLSRHPSPPLFSFFSTHRRDARRRRRSLLPFPSRRPYAVDCAPFFPESPVPDCVLLPFCENLVGRAVGAPLETMVGEEWLFLTHLTCCVPFSLFYAGERGW